MSGFADASGPEDASVLIVGEAPGKDEIKKGKPFTGPSGRLLDKVLAHHGFNRDEIRLTNTVACHPRGVRAERPPKEAISACKPRLSAELQRRETIILLGKTAFETVMETREAITKARQHPARTDPRFPGARIVATIHPAACLRSSDYFPSLVRDIRKAKSQIAIKWEPPKYSVHDSEESALDIVDSLQRRNLPHIIVDVETAVEKDESFTHPDTLLCVGLGVGYNESIVVGEQALRYPTVRRRLGDFLDASRVVCQNGKFDIQVLMRLGYLDEPNLYGDTMLASYCKDERPGHHSLGGRASEELGAPDWKGELKPYLGKGKKKSYANVPRDILYRYNAYDDSEEFKLWEKDVRELDAQGLRPLHDFLVAASNELTHIELEGVRIDEHYLARLIEDYSQDLAGLEEGLKLWVDNPRSTPQVLNACKDLQLLVKDTAAPTLSPLLEGNRTAEQRDFLERILHYRKEHKLYGTYVKGTLKRLSNNRLYTTFKLHGTVTGRLSSANPNLQNIPRGSKIKNLFIPEEGNVFIQGDYKQAEWRAIACLAEDKYLQKALSDPNQDIHGYTAELFFGPNFTKDQRVMAKTFVFGVAYGRGADAVGRAFGVSVYKAQEYIDNFFAAIPEVVAWRKQVHEQIFKGGQALQTPFGRKRRFWLITRENKHDIEKEALAFLPQSIASDLTLNSLIRLRQAFGSSKDSPKVRLTVHDSILCECPEQDRNEVAQEIRSIMESTAADVFSDFVPFPVDIETGKSWGNLS
jgi:uracil-DNA glycosylase family 4